MKKIVCELCGGTVFDKVDGRFVCKECGTSYSVEEARGLMREVEGDEPVATGAPVMPQANPNQQRLDNILLLATNAKEAGNNQEAENYCNQAITLDAMAYKAWFLKGKAIGWSSSLGKNRMQEAAHSFCKAIEFAPDEEKKSLTSQAVEELKNLGLACISARAENFINNPAESELKGFVTDGKVLLESLEVLLASGNSVGMPEGYRKEAAVKMANAAGQAMVKCKTVWENANHPSERDLCTYIDWMDNCASLLRQAIIISDDDDEADIYRYELLIMAIEAPIGQYSWTREWSSLHSKYVDVCDKCLNDLAVDERRKQVAECKKEIEKIKKAAKDKKKEEERKAEEAKKARIEAYWAAHTDEKAALDSESRELTTKKDSLTKEIAELDGQIIAATPTGNVPSEDEKSKIKDQISDLNNRRAKLGLFAGKEKKQIGEEIASLEGRISALDSKIEEEKKVRKAETDRKIAPIKTKRDELQGQLDSATKRITAINKELTKDPEE